MQKLEGKHAKAASFLYDQAEVYTMQDYTNIVYIKRMGINDHGPVHMRKATLNALLMFDLLTEKSIQFNLVKEGAGDIEDSKVAVIVASLLHDVGMSVSRDNHELNSITLATPIIKKVLKLIYPDDIQKNIILQSIIFEGIFGHMANRKIESLEAGLVLVGDGCDMEKGRARIPYLIANHPKVGDIHKYSSYAIQRVTISQGDRKPIKILIEMHESVGFFQIEEVLFPKILSSPVMPYIELYGQVINKKPRCYLK